MGDSYNQWVSKQIEDGRYVGTVVEHVPAGAHTVIARIRRGRWVMIPAKWRGQITHRQAIRLRASKRPHKQRRTPYPKGRRGTMVPVNPEERLTRQERAAALDEQR